MEPPFDRTAAQETLKKKETQKQELLETTRLEVLNHTTEVIKNYFKNKNVNVFLIGSLIIPHQFTPSSDVDIVLKNFHGDRFEVWPELESLIGRQVEIILYEKCPFQDHVDRNGMKVI